MLSIFTLLFNKSQGFFHVTKWNLCRHETTPYLSLPSRLGKHHSAVSMNLTAFFFCLIYVRSYRICLLGLTYSLSIASSRFIHAVASDRIPFLFNPECSSIICINLSYSFIINRQLGCFHLSAVVNNAVISESVPSSLWVPHYLNDDKGTWYVGENKIHSLY